MAYDAWDVEFQNCIALDGDQGSYYTPQATTTAKAFTTRSGGVPGITVQGIYYRGCISLANRDMLGWMGSGTTSHVVTNCIHWGSNGGTRIRAAGSSFDHCTFGAVTGTDSWSPLAYLEYGDPIRNSLLYNAYYGIWNAGPSSGYNALYSINSEYVGSASPSTYDKSAARGNAIDPLDGTPGNGTAALKYLLRIEPRSDLKGAASDQGDIGATIIKQMGKAGTVWGQAGYNLLQDGTNGQINADLWPYPNEDLIRAQMRAYSYDNGRLTGNRGFCADGQTLTKYIWEYLGNTIPPEVYGDGKVISAPSGVTIQIIQ